MIDYSKAPIIDDHNYRDFIDPVVDGETMHCVACPRDLHRHPIGGLGFAAPVRFNVIPEVELKRRIIARKAAHRTNKEFLEHYKIPVKNQQSTNYCWVNACVGALEITRAKQNQKYIDLSPASCGSIITNFRNIGGYGLDAIEFLHDKGAVPSNLWPANAISKTYNTTVNNNERVKFRVDEWNEIAQNDLNQLNAALDAGFVVCAGLSWWRHEIIFIDLDIDNNGNIVYVFRNSWGSNWGDNGHGVMTANKARGDYVMCRSVVAA